MSHYVLKPVPSFSHFCKLSVHSMLIHHASPGSHGVQDVLPLRDPFQVFKVVVVAVPVFVVDHKAGVIAEKRLSHKPVDISPLHLVKAAKANLAVALGPPYLQQP